MSLVKRQKVDKRGIIYISLAEAAQECRYSQEYLSLRARHGKLKSVKRGRNWYTTQDWLLEYLSYCDDLRKNEAKNGILSGNRPPKLSQQIIEAKKPSLAGQKPGIKQNFWVLLLLGAKNRVLAIFQTLRQAQGIIINSIRIKLELIRESFVDLSEFINVSYKGKDIKVYFKSVVAGFVVVLSIFLLLNFISAFNVTTQAKIGLAIEDSTDFTVKSAKTAYSAVVSAENRIFASLDRLSAEILDGIVQTSEMSNEELAIFYAKHLWQKGTELLAVVNEQIPQKAGKFGLAVLASPHKVQFVAKGLATKLEERASRNFGNFSDGFSLMREQLKNNVNVVMSDNDMNLSLSDIDRLTTSVRNFSASIQDKIFGFRNSIVSGASKLSQSISSGPQKITGAISKVNQKISDFLFGDVTPINSNFVVIKKEKTEIVKEASKVVKPVTEITQKETTKVTEKISEVTRITEVVKPAELSALELKLLTRIEEVRAGLILAISSQVSGGVSGHTYIWAPAERIDNLGQVTINGLRWPSDKGNAGQFLMTNGSDSMGWSNISWNWVAEAAGWSYDGAIVRLTQSSDSVGIGTSSPFAKLSVAGAAGAATPVFAISTSTAAFATSTALVVDANGWVGIGTSSPYRHLSVNGDLYVDGGIYAHNGIGLNGQVLQTTGSVAQWVSTSTLFIAGADVLPLGIQGQTLTFQSGFWQATSTIYISSGGNMGLGTTSPYAKLSVVGPVVAEYFYATSTNATSTFAGGLVAANSLYILQNGNVGIGTNGPAYKLDVDGTLRTTGISYFNADTYLGNATTSDVIVFNSRIGTHLIPTIDNVSDLGDSTNWLRWRTGLFGTSVGIGGTATSTGSQLTTSGVYLINSGSTLSFNTTNNQPIIFGAGNVILPYASSTALTISGVASTTVLYVSNNQYLSQMTPGSILFAGASGLISQNNQNLFWDNTNNRLGLGTTSPYAKLSVMSTSGDGATPLFVVASSTNGTGTSTAFYISPNGLVGIGTTSPTWALDISVNAGGDRGIQVTNTASNGLAVVAVNNDVGATGGIFLTGSTVSLPHLVSRLAVLTDATATGIDLVAQKSTGDIRVYTGGLATSNERLRVDSSGNVGIGTTSPFAKLSVNGSAGGTIPLFVVASSTASYATSTAFLIDSQGNVGIGTPAIAAGNAFHVQGQCVTGDTKLRRRRRKSKFSPCGGSPEGRQIQNSDDEYIYDEVMIKDIQPGDEIASLNEKTGKIVWSRVNALMDMGVKEIYKLTTESGKQIRTTGNHPYLARISSPFGLDVNKQKIQQTTTVFEVDQSNRIEELNRDSFVSVANKELAVTIKIPAKVKKELYNYYRGKYRSKFGFQYFANAIAVAVKLSNFRITDLIIDFEYPGRERDIAAIIKRCLGANAPEIYFKSIGKKSPAHQAAYTANTKNLPVSAILDFEQIKTAAVPCGAKELLHHGVDTVDSQSARPLYGSISEQKILSRGGEPADAKAMAGEGSLSESVDSRCAKWIKVIYLREGMEIAAADLKSDFKGVSKSDFGSVKFDKIVKIEILPPEQVYDIEVENTHNFIANDIVAHNTYISGNVGIGTSSPQAKLEVVNTSSGATAGQLYLSNLASATSTASRLTFRANDITNATSTSAITAILTQNYDTGKGNLAFSTLRSGTLTEAMRIMDTGNVGVGTTSPAQLFSVAGHCITGDSKLRRRKKRRNKNGVDEYEYDEVAVKDIQPGDEIASLNEKTGEIEYQTVRSLLDMGVQTTYRLVTSDSRQIRTTKEHPYLVKEIGQRNPKHTSSIKNAGWLEVKDIRPDDYIAAPKPKVGIFIDDANMFYSQKQKKWRVDYSKLKAVLEKDFDVRFMNYYAAVPKESDQPAYYKTQKYLDKIDGLNIFDIKTKPLKYIFETIRFENGEVLERVVRKGNFDVEITRDVLNNLKEIDTVIVVSGDSDFVGLREDVWAKDKQILFLAFKDNLAIELKNGKYFTFEKLRKWVEWGQKNTPELFGGTLLSLVYSHQEILSRGNGDNSAFIWAKVKSIEKVSEEQVYDLEVENTHNFIANGIIAHNTYITGGFGAGIVEATNGNITGIGRLSVQSTTATSTFSTGGLTVGTSQFVVQQTSGNVGIGTTSPSVKLSVGGAAGDTTGHGYFTGGLGVGVVNTTANTFRVGQCVTGDTRLKRRRRKSKFKNQNANSQFKIKKLGEDNEYIYEEVAIVDVQPGDEVISLNEKTGDLEWQPILALYDMGEKPIYKIITASGKTIRTTSNHPYLTKHGWIPVGDLREGNEIGLPKKEALTAVSSRAMKNTRNDESMIFDKEFGSPITNLKSMSSFGIVKNAFSENQRIWSLAIIFQFINNALTYIWSKTLSVFLRGMRKNKTPYTNLYRRHDFISSLICSTETARPNLISRSASFFSFFRAVRYAGLNDSISSTVSSISKARAFDIFQFDASATAMRFSNLSVSHFGILGLESPLRKVSGFHVIFNSFNRILRSLINSSSSRRFGCGEYNKSESDKIFARVLAIWRQFNKWINSLSSDRDIIWDKIVSIEYAGIEKVWDISVKNTHNFVANGILAHNTAFIVDSSGNTGVSTTSPYAKLSVVGPVVAEYFHATSTTASSTISGNLLVGNLLQIGSGTTYISGAATSTFGNGISLSNGCFSVGGVCIVSGTATALNDLSDVDTTGVSYGNLIMYNGSAWQDTATSSLQIDFSNTTGTVPINRGGTNLTAAPSYGQVLVGTAANIYALQATSTLGFESPLTFSSPLSRSTNTISILQANASQNGYLSLTDWSTFNNKISSSTISSLNNNYLAKWNGTTNVFNNSQIIDTGTNVGIGTSSPYAKLSVTGSAGGTSPLFVISSSTASYATSTAFLIDSQGNVGIGTPAIAAGNAFYVQGQCVTGDTKLRRRRRRRKSEARSTKSETPDDEYIYDEVQIKDIQPGDEIASLNEKTGKIVWSRVNALMDMGVKEIYKIITEDGKTIRTTGNHPYLAVSAANKKPAQSADSSENSNKAWNSGLSTYDQYSSSENLVKSRAVDNLNTLEVGGIEPPDFWLTIQRPHQVTPRASSLYYSNLSQATWTKVVYLNEGDEIAVPDENYESVKFVKIRKIKILPPEQVYDIEVEGTHNFIGNDIVAHNTYISGNVGIGTTSPGAKLSVAGSGLFDGSITAYGGFIGSSITATSSLTISASDTASSSVNNLLTLEHLSSGSGGLAGIGGAILFNAEDTGGSSTSTARILSALSNVSTTSPASYLAFETKGTTGSLTERMRILNDGNVGIGTTSPVAALGVNGLMYIGGTGTSTIQNNLWVQGTLRTGTGSIYMNDGSITAANGGFQLNTSATSTFATNGFTIGTSQFVVQQTSGNVGIGTTSPYAKLSVVGPVVAEYFHATSTTASSTISGNLLVGNLLQIGSGTTYISGAATSTFGNGISLSNGCFSVGGVCIVSGTATALNDLSDVDTTGVSYGNLIMYNGSSWADTATSSLQIDLSNTTGTVPINRGGTNLTAAPSYGQVLVGTAANIYALQATSTLGFESPLTFSSPLSRSTNTISILQANASQNGYLSSGDWIIFNNKISSSSLSATAPITYNSTTGIIACNSANASQAGCLSTTDWSTFNNKMSSSTISSLTASYIPKWNTTGFANSLIYDSGTNIGISTTSPQTKLEVVNISSGLTADQLYLSNLASATSTASRLTFRANDLINGTSTGAITGILTQNYYTGAGNLSFSTLRSGTLTEAMRILDSGKVGIGTTSPGTLLSLGNTGASTINISATATSTFGTGINLRTGCFSVGGVCVRSGTATALDDLTDVTIASAAYGDFLMYNGSVWADTATSSLGIALSDTTGTLAVNRGGTNLTSYTKNQLLYASDTGVIGQIATSSLGLLTTNVAEGTNLYWTDNRFDVRLTATTTLPALTTLANLTTVGTITSGTWSATAISATKGGTGLTSYVIGDIIYSDAANSLARLATSTKGSVLQLSFSTGLPSYVATSSLGIALSDTTGTLAVNRGGTNLTSYTKNQLLYASDTGVIGQIATSSLGLLTTNVAEGTNLYWTDNRFDVRLTATTTLPALTTLANLATVGTITSGTWSATAISATKGGTGLTSYVIGDIIYSDAANSLARLATSTKGSILQLSLTTGLPSYVATSSLGLLSSSLAKGYFIVGDDAGTAQATSSIFISSSGNVGIGTTGPLGKLQIGSLTSGSGEPTYHGDLILQGAPTASQSTGGIEFKSNEGASGFGWKITSLQATGDPLVFASRVNSATWSDRVTILAAGNVGIGTTSPSSKLHVNSTSGAGVLSIGSSDGGINNETLQFLSAYSVLANTSDITASIIGAPDAATGGRLLFNTTNTSGTVTERMRIDASGNVGIGTTTPGAKLSVAGGVLINDNLIASNITATGTLAVQSTTATSTFSTGGLTVGTSQFVVQQTSGNVGIGTTGPGQKLQVVGGQFGVFNSASTGGLSVDGAAQAGMTSVYSDYLGGTEPKLHLSSYGGRDSAAGITIDTSGNVGIGTTGPGAKLEITGSAGAESTIKLKVTNALRRTLFLGSNQLVINRSSIDGVFEDTGYAAASIYFDNETSGDSNIRFNTHTSNNTNPLERVRITNTGNVGIGTTSPGTLLSLGNTGASTINISANATSTFGTGIDLRTGCFAVNGVCVSGAGGGGSGTVGTGAIGQIPYYAAAGTTLTATSTLTISAAQFIGLGTTTPQAKLHIGNASTTMLTSLDESVFIENQLEVLGNVYLGPMSFPDDGGVVSWIDMTINSTVATSTIESYTARLGGADVLTIYGTARGYLGGVVAASSTVGIGTTSPYAKLSVVKINPNPDEHIFAISTSTSGVIYYVDEDGDVRYDGTASSPAADYAEYFYTDDTDLKAGELVCVDASKSNAVKRCGAGQSIGLVGVISAKPSLVGNSQWEYDQDPHYVIVGLLGQIKTLASAENGAILPGDSLIVSSTTPGLAMKAAYGGEIIGTALENLANATGTINVLVKSRWYSGTSAPSSLALAGEISASAFINISTREAKKEISFLNNQDEDEILAKIASTTVASYLYNSDADCDGDSSSPQMRGGLRWGADSNTTTPGPSSTEEGRNCRRLGLIAEEAPREVLSLDSKGVDIYKMVSFAWVGLKAQQRQIDKLISDVEAIKMKLNMAGGIGDTPPLGGAGGDFLGGFSSILDAFKQIGSVFENGLARFKKLFAEEVEVASLRINNNSPQPSLYQRESEGEFNLTATSTYRTIGSAEIATTTTDIFVETSAIELGSKIFVTPLTLIDQPLAVVEQVACVVVPLLTQGGAGGELNSENSPLTPLSIKGGTQGFRVAVKYPAIEAIKFNWWIVQTGPKQECPTPPVAENNQAPNSPPTGDLPQGDNDQNNNSVIPSEVEESPSSPAGESGQQPLIEPPVQEPVIEPLPEPPTEELPAEIPADLPAEASAEAGAPIEAPPIEEPSLEQLPIQEPPAETPVPSEPTQ